MFIRMQLPLKKKIPVVGIFSLGLFVILAAVLNKYYSFSHPFGAMWTYWYVRESSTALLVANLPFVWTFWRRLLTGKKTSVDTISKQNSPESAMSREDKNQSRRRDSARQGVGWPWNIEGADNSSGELEMGPGRGKQANGGMTLHDILRESTPDLEDQEHVSPLTHPSLFYARNNKTAELDKRRHIERIVLAWNDTSESSRPGETPVSSRFPQSLNSKRSTASFV
jgi:hypothetical protein